MTLDLDQVFCDIDDFNAVFEPPVQGATTPGREGQAVQEFESVAEGCKCTFSRVVWNDGIVNQ